MTLGLMLDVLWAVIGAPAACGVEVAAGLDSETASLVLVAAGQAAVAAHRESEALACLDAARDRYETALVQEERAFLLYRLGRHGAALHAVRRALRLGDVDPEAHLLEAEILTALGRVDAAREAARRAGSWEGDLVGASLQDVAAAYRAVQYVGEQTDRGALTALTLGAGAFEEGRVRTARGLFRRAERSAELAARPEVQTVAAELLDRAKRGPSWRWSARAGSSLDFATNPGFRARGDPELERGLRVALNAEGSVAADIGAVRAMLALRLDQHLFVAPRALPADLDVFGLALSGAFELPLSRDPSFVVLGVSVRFSDLHGDRFARRHATSFEGGPYLGLRLGPGLWMNLGFFGVVTDFGDEDTADGAFSPVDRDRGGQRGLVGVRYNSDWLDIRVDGMFLRDDAVGDAFDGIGGAVAVRLDTRPEEGLHVFAGVALTLTEFGPVGDSAIIGPAARRTELRTVAEGGVRFALLAHVDFVVKDTWIDNAARDGHAYTENVLSMGFEAWW